MSKSLADISKSLVAWLIWILFAEYKDKMRIKIICHQIKKYLCDLPQIPRILACRLTFIPVFIIKTKVLHSKHFLPTSKKGNGT